MGREAMQQEPVAWLDAEMSQAYTVDELADASGTGFLPLYTAPQKQWVGLTDEDMEALFLNEDGVRFARYIEAKLKEKNYG